MQRRLQDQHKQNQRRLDFAGDRSVAWRVFRCAASLLADSHVARALAVATSLSQLQAVVQQHGPSHPHLQRLADAVLVHVDTPQVMLLHVKGLDVNRMYAATRLLNRGTDSTGACGYLTCDAWACECSEFDQNGCNNETVKLWHIRDFFCIDRACLAMAILETRLVYAS